ncbi:MAG TPA: imidazolonepropionase [Bacillota bacterium]|nr:imidazolonepropionase [Bacillota bacterium]
MSSLFIKNIGTLQTPVGSYPHKGEEQGQNQVLRNVAIEIREGIIQAIYTSEDLLPEEEDFDMILDAEGNLVTPGLVDGHTHLVFGGYRQHEIPLKLKGASYLEILESGGGILDTVRKTREASFEELYEKSEGFLDEMMAMGVTTCEAKSGYGLDRDTELRTLEVIAELKDNHPMDMVATYMGAHAIPPEYQGRGDEYIDVLCKEVMEEVALHKLAQYVDVFCEASVFDPDQSERYLKMAQALGLGIRIHADEIQEIGGSQLAGRLKAASAEHLIAIGEEGIQALAQGGTIAMLLPATSFYLGKNFAPARKMVEAGVPVAMVTDFNPGSSPSLNLGFVMNLGYLKYGLTPEEILTAVTINPACALGMENQVGTVEVGKQADLVIWNAPDMEMLCYRYGSNLALGVVKKGQLV